jgi:hypothetical protein
MQYMRTMLGALFFAIIAGVIAIVVQKTQLAPSAPAPAKATTKELAR